MTTREETAAPVPPLPAVYDPIPVLVSKPVTVKEKPARSWSAVQLPVPVWPEMVRVAPQHAARTKCWILNTSEATVTLGPEQGTTAPGTGLPLGKGEKADMSHTAEVWATAAGAGASVVIYSEYVDGQ